MSMQMSMQMSANVYQILNVLHKIFSQY